MGEFSLDGIAGVWERDARDGDGTELVLYFESDRLPPLVRARVGRVFERNGYLPPALSVGLQEREDWTREWRKGFTSFPLGNRFRVVPSWEAPPGGDDRIPIRVDPGLAFGTGTHETTQLMIEALESIGPSASGPVLDLGTGSAILSIAAALLGHRAVVACDVDRDAVGVARENLRRNRSDAELFVGSADAIAPGTIGLLLANLTADVIAELLDDIARLLRAGATAVFSGILLAQAEEVRDRIAGAGFRVGGRRVRGEWTVMVAVRSSH